MDRVGLFEPRKRLGMKLQLDQQRSAFVHRIEMTRVERKRVIIGQQRFLESLLLALEIADPDPDVGAVRLELERDLIALQGFRKPALARQLASEIGKIFGIALIDADRARHEIDREIDPVRLRMKLAREIKGSRRAAAPTPAPAVSALRRPQTVRTENAASRHHGAMRRSSSADAILPPARSCLRFITLCRFDDVASLFAVVDLQQTRKPQTATSRASQTCATRNRSARMRSITSA